MSSTRYVVIREARDVIYEDDRVVSDACQVAQKSSGRVEVRKYWSTGDGEVILDRFEYQNGENRHTSFHIITPSDLEAMVAVSKKTLDTNPLQLTFDF